MNIGAMKSLWTGAGRVLREWRMWILFYAMNLLFAAVLALPFAAVFASNVSKSLAGSDLLSGFSYRWYVEFIHANGAYFGSLVPQIVLLFSIYVLMEVFLAGGFYPAFDSRERARLSSFFSNSASNFFPLLMVTLGEVLLLFVLYKLDAIWARAGRGAAINALTDAQVFHAGLLRYGVVAVLFIAINMLSDFVRAAVTLDDDALFSRINRGFSFVVKHPLSSLGLYTGCTAVSAVVIALFFFVHNGVYEVDEGTVLFAIAVGQIFILLRIFSKLIFYAGEAILYKENQIEVIQVKPEMLE